MNRGLKEIYNQISDSEGLIDYKLNLYNADNNLFINIPLFNTNNKLLNLYLIYNHQYKNTLKDCGKGFRLNFYKHLDGDSIYPYLEEADKTTDLTSNYYTSIIDERTYDLTFYDDDPDNPEVYDLTINDFNQNEIYMITQRKYPNYINLRDGYQFIFDFNQYNNLIRIKDKKNNNIFNKLEFTYYNNSNLISKVEYYDSNNVLVSYVEFEYDNTNTYLTKIKYKTNQDVEKCRLEFEYNSSYLKITTYEGTVDINEFKYNFNSNNKITSIYNYEGVVYTFNYYNDYSIVYDKYNNQMNYYFKDNKLLYTKDSYSNITYFEYDIYERLIFNVNNINLLDNTYNMISNISPAYYFTLNSNYKYMLIILTNNQITLTLKGTIYSNSNEEDEYIYDYYTINGFKILFIDVYDYNEISVSNTNYVYNIILLRDKDYTKYEYNNKSYITKIETLKANTICTYDNNGNMLTKNDGISTLTYTYDTNNNVLTKTDGVTTDNYTYDSYNNVLTKHTTITDSLYNQPTYYYSYNSNNMLYQSGFEYYDSFNNVTTNRLLDKRQYTNDLKIVEISNYYYYNNGEISNLSPTSEYNYDNKRRQTKIRNSSYYDATDDEASIITLDINKTYTNVDLTKVELMSQSIDNSYIDYNYTYDLDHRLIGIKYNHDDFNNPYSDIVFISYNQNNDIYNYNMYGNIYEYNYNLNSSINFIELNNQTICTYLYDNKNNIIRINDNILNLYTLYSYDMENRINHMNIYGMNKYVKYDEYNRISELRYQNTYFNQSMDIEYLDNGYLIKSKDYNIKSKYDYIIFKNSLESIHHKHELDDSYYYINDGYLYPNPKVCYRFSEYNTNEFTIFLEMYNINTAGKIVEFNDYTHSITIENINNKIVIKIDNNTYNTNYSIISGIFYIYMTYGKIEVEIDNDGNYETYNDYKFIIEANNTRNIYSYSLNEFNYSNIKTIIYKPIKFLAYNNSFQEYYYLNDFIELKDNKYNESILKINGLNEIGYYELKDSSFNTIYYAAYAYNEQNLVKAMKYDGLDRENKLEYDNRGLVINYKIKQVNSSNSLLEFNYEYDPMGRITEEKIVINNSPILFYVYTYYNNGDIKTYDNKLYVYENGILISIDNNQLTYTNKYFLHTYLGKTYNWTNNRLSSYVDSNNNIYYYVYDYKGLRRKKIHNNLVTTFYYDDNNRLIYERIEESNQTKEVTYIYDMKELIGFKYNGNRYYYIKDLLGNICYIINENKSILVTYKYSAYGIIEETGNLEIRNINHFKYKSYYYDNESNMYYLITRYYLPEIGRFISPDDINYLDINKHTGYNLYSYCNNNPVMYSDPEGNLPEWLKWTIGGIIIAGSIIAIPFTGGASSSFIPVAIGATVGAGAGILSGVTYTENGFYFDSNRASTGFMTGAIFGAISGSSSAAITSFSKISVDSMAYRGIMAAIDGTLGLGDYLMQNVINGTFDDISVMGCIISFSLGVLDFCYPLGKYFDSIYNPIFSAELAYVYDEISKKTKKKKKRIL